MTSACEDNDECECTRNILFQQYRLFVEMADKISDRRQSANSYFLTIHTGLLAIVGVSTKINSQQFLWLIGVAGMILAFLWQRLVVAHKDLNSAKFRVIHELEAALPAQPYKREWTIVDEGRNPKKYRPVSHIELLVPWVFFVLHGLVAFFKLPFAQISPVVSKLLGE